jgi:glycosyltransferase involved in cell wall biosynthesis
MKKATLSLSVITGNCENHIERFLNNFQHHFDEVVIVRAIGNQEPDCTLDIAQSRGCIIGEYFNKILGWPHVDDFGAARNVSANLATGDWIMWADTDDIMTDDSGEQIRRLISDINDKAVDGVLMRYVVPEDNIINWRERIWRKGSAMWEHPVHECLKFNEGTNHMRFDGAEIIHASEKRSASRDERNLRILESIPKSARTVSQKFHTFQSLIALDRNDEAIQSALEFVQSEGVGRNELYEAYFQLARLADDEETKKQMLLAALATDPSRREAYGELGLAATISDAQSALGWTEAMMGLEIPPEPPWNLRRPYYGSLGIGLRGMALRANNRREEADAIETNHFIRNGAKISLLHATRGRPAQAWRARMEWLRSATNPDAIEHIFAIDVDDVQSYPLTNARCVISTHNSGCVGAWNTAAQSCSGQILIQLSDDWKPFQGWDEAILCAIGDTSKPKVLAISDGFRKDDLLCMAIMTRARYIEQGHFFHPEFFSMFSDNWFSYKAAQDGVIIDAKAKILFEHAHPAFGKAESDQTYERSNDGYHYLTGQGIFNRLVSGSPVSTDIHGWFDFRDVYDYVAKKIPECGQFVEVGAWKGKSAVYLADRLEDINKPIKFHVVDTFKGDDETGRVEVLEEFKNNRGSREISIIEGDSAESASQFADDSLDGVFIDAAHDYASAKRDIEAWLSKVKKGGFFGGHDADSEGVSKALESLGIKYNMVGRCWIKQNEKP